VSFRVVLESLISPSAPLSHTVNREIVLWLTL
jgi:hypothetical protein